MKVYKISEPRDLKQKWRSQTDPVWFRGVLTASLGICSIDAMETQQFANVGGKWGHQAVDKSTFKSPDLWSFF